MTTRKRQRYPADAATIGAELPGDAERIAEVEADAAERASLRADEAAEVAAERAELAGTVCAYGPGGPMSTDQLTPGDIAAMADFQRHLRERRTEAAPTERTPAEVDPVGAVNQLGAVWSPDLDAYATGQLDAAAVRCVLCGTAPCQCPPFGTPDYLALVDRVHGRTR
jgi:hypothetical protein